MCLNRWPHSTRDLILTFVFQCCSKCLLAVCSRECDFFFHHLLAGSVLGTTLEPQKMMMQRRIIHIVKAITGNSQHPLQHIYCLQSEASLEQLQD